MPELNIILQNGVMTAAQQTTMNLQELVINMKASGMGSDAIRNVLLNDLNTGGAIFGNFKNSVKKTVAGGVGMAGNGAAFQKYTKAGVKTFRWITAGAKSCPDCIPRHGETGSMEYFETIGVPKSGFSVCGANCQCTLVPEGYNGENLEKPLVRGKKKFIKFEKGSAWTPRIKNKINTSHDRLRSMGYKIPKQKPVEMIVGDDRPGGFFSAMSGDGKRLTVNHRLLFSKVSQKKLDDVVSAGLFPRGTNSASAMLDHEFAHAISSTISREARNKINHIYKKYVSEINRKYDSPLKAIAKKRIEFFDKLKDEINQARISGATTHEISVMTKKVMNY